MSVPSQAPVSSQRSRYVLFLNSVRPHTGHIDNTSLGGSVIARPPFPVTISSEYVFVDRPRSLPSTSTGNVSQPVIWLPLIAASAASLTTKQDTLIHSNGIAFEP